MLTAAQSATVGLWERWMGLEIGDPERFEQLTIPGRMVHVKTPTLPRSPL